MTILIKRLPAVAVCLALLTLSLGASAHAGDWPQFRHDAARSAATAEELPATLYLQWVREYPSPRPAFPTELRLRYDASYEPVVAGKTMLVPSMVTDSVTALDVDTGRRRWRFFADGPVRFAPVAGKGRVYFVSDDGYLYCLDAADGKFRGRVRGLPADRKDRKIMGNGRLISLYPARGGPVLADGIVYFAAGLWPNSGVFVHALDADTGRVVWSNTDSNRIAKANLDHGVRSPAGLAPQGYLAVLGEKLVVPCGAQLPGFLDRKTGKREDYTTGWGGRVGLPKGSWFVAGAGNLLMHSGDLFDVSRPNDERFARSHGPTDFKRLLYPGGYTRLQIDPACQKGLGAFREAVFAHDVMYVNTREGHVAAYDLSRPNMEPRTRQNTPTIRKNDEYPDKWQVAFPELWRLSEKFTVHVKAGPRVYVGAAGVVAAIDIPAGEDRPKVSWRADIEGVPSRMLVADGKLFVVTLEGRIYAFGAKNDPAPAFYKNSAPAVEESSDAWAAKAARILKETGTGDGYALVLGMGTGRLAEELVRQSKLYVIGIDSDREKVAAIREKFARAGLYGTRMTVHAGQPAAYPFPPYLASLIVSENGSGAAESLGSAVAERVFPWLRPYGGTACFPAPAQHRAGLVEKLAALKLPGTTIRSTGEMILLTRDGPLPGAADWSHEGADAANTGACADRLAKAPLDLLWFNAPHRWHRKPGGPRARVAGGRVLVLADDLQAFDVYTGRPMWQTALPFSGAAAARGGFVATGEAVFVTAGRTCLVVDSATGRELGRIELPAQLGSEAAGSWSKLCIVDDYLLGTVGKHVVCIDRGDGKVLWSYRARHERLSLAVCPEKVFCAELAPARNRRAAAASAVKPQIDALDIKTGKLLWQVSGAGPVRYSQAHDLVVTAGGIYRGKDGTRTGDGHAAWCIAGERLICGTSAEAIEIRDLVTGNPAADPLQWYRRGCTVLRASRHLVTTRSGGNVAYVDLATRKITPIRSVRSACYNNLFPADGVLNVPNMTAGCTCNYTPTSIALAPSAAIAEAMPGD